MLYITAWLVTYSVNNT